MDNYKFGILHSKFDLLDISNIDLILNPNVDFIHYKLYIFRLIYKEYDQDNDIYQKSSHKRMFQDMINKLYLLKLVNHMDKLSIYFIKHYNKKNSHTFNIYFFNNSSVQEVHKIYIFLNLLKMVETLDRYIFLITSYNIFHQYNIFLYIFLLYIEFSKISLYPVINQYMYMD